MHIHFKVFNVLILLLLFTGCAQKVTFFSEKKIGSTPQLNIDTYADIGDSLYEEYDYVSTPVANCVNAIDMSYYLGSINISTNAPLIKVIIGNETQYCSELKTYIDPLVGAFDYVCFKSDLNSHQFTDVRVPKIMLGSWSKLDRPIEYKELILNTSTKGLKKELLYNGNYKGELKIQYREYLNDFARPAFYQDISYELQHGDNEVHIKGVKLLIYGQEKNKIHYKVLNGFKK